MELGQWIEFDTVVRRQRQSGGTVWAPRTLQQPRTGVVVGVRPMYDAQPGTPPVLSNRREVLLVAVSLHTSVRVMPGDARLLAGPPAPRQRRQRSAPAPSAVVAPAGPLDAPSDAELQLWLADALNLALGTGQLFTAYDITQALRAAHPHDNIAHEPVRELVHQAMQHVIQSGLYQSEQASFGASTAVRYVPA